MFLLNYLLVTLAFFMIAAPVTVNANKPGCDKCPHEGDTKCGMVGLGNKGTRVCRRGCWTVNNLVCQENEICRERPTVHCTTQAKACAGCTDFLDHCRDDFWSICNEDCQVVCAKKTCEFDGGTGYLTAMRLVYMKGPVRFGRYEHAGVDVGTGTGQRLCALTSTSHYGRLLEISIPLVKSSQFRHYNIYPSADLIMKLLNYFLAIFTLVTLMCPVLAKGPSCNKCDAKGTFRCAPKGSSHIEACGDDLCWGPSGKDCAAGSHCVEGESIYCKNTAEACAGCNEFFTHCVKDYWNECDVYCEMICERKTCSAFEGRCKNECLMKGCENWS